MSEVPCLLARFDPTSGVEDEVIAAHTRPWLFAPLLAQAVCVYGYSLGPFLLATIVCAIPLQYISVVALAVAGVLSMVFLLRTFTPLVMEKNTALSAPIIAALG